MTFDQGAFDRLAAQRLALIDKMQTIQTQLSNKNVTDAEGRRVWGDDYHGWRHRALTALRITTRELRDTNAQLKELRRGRNEQVIGAAGLNLKDPTSLISAAYMLLHRLASDGVEIDPHEQLVIDGLQHFLQFSGQVASHD